MSLINKMLQDLDRRHALGTGADAPPKGLEAGVHPVPKSRGPRRLVGSELFWWVMSGLMLIMVGWLGWVMWQLMPHSVITEQVPLAQVERAARGAPVIDAARSVVANDAARGAPAPDAGANAPAAAANAPTAASSAPPPAAASSQVAVQPGTPNQPSAPAGNASPRPGAPKPAPSVDMLKLATEIATPIPARKPVAVAVPRAPAAPATRPATAAPAASAPAPGLPAAPTVAPPAAPPQAAREPRIERQNAGGPAAADAQYAHAVALINQGRVSEGMDELRSVLAAAPRMESARQTMVALLLEQKRPDEAEAALTQGLALNPAQKSFAMLLARLMVDRRDNAAALAVLQKHAGAAAGNPDYRAFTAAVLQRLERHAEAVAEYQAALSLPQQGTGQTAGAAQAAVWWVGLGISQEALGRKAEARDAFQRARASGALSRDVSAFVEQRLAQLQP